MEPQDEITRLQAELAEPAGLTAAELAVLAPFSQPGTCTGCHTPLVPPRNGKCWACAELQALKPVPPAACRFGVPGCSIQHRILAVPGRSRDSGSQALTRAALLVTGIILVWLAGYVWVPLVLPAIVCVGMASRRR